METMERRGTMAIGVWSEVGLNLLQRKWHHMVENWKFEVEERYGFVPYTWRVTIAAENSM